MVDCRVRWWRRQYCGGGVGEAVLDPDRKNNCGAEKGRYNSDDYGTVTTPATVVEVKEPEMWRRRFD
ncbi:hypothetical protein L1887_14704 [Cichorium endivia]|nr:hypothetical protein L1887_14704 [Cichorium endivia]